MAMSWPLDGVYNKDFRTTSSFGWRIHPIRKVRKHHNGEDLISTSYNPAYCKAIFDGVVIEARAARGKKSNGEPNGYGYFVAVKHVIGGKKYVALYAHLKKNSFQVKKGQRVKAGQILGTMGTSGASTGVHLHFEIHLGHKVGWSNNGSGFLDPIPFLYALETFEREAGKGWDPTPDNSPTQDAPVHSAVRPKPKKYDAPNSKPQLQGWLKVGSNSEAVAYLQKALKIKVDGIFGNQTKRAVQKFQDENRLTVDGIVGTQTWPMIKVEGKTTPSPKEPTTQVKAVVKPKYPGRVLKVGSRGASVKYLQEKLKITADGIFGPQTENAVKSFQRKKNIAVDGIVGPVTWGKL